MTRQIKNVGFKNYKLYIIHYPKLPSCWLPNLVLLCNNILIDWIFIIPYNNTIRLYSLLQFTVSELCYRLILQQTIYYNNFGILIIDMSTTSPVYYHIISKLMLLQCTSLMWQFLVPHHFKMEDVKLSLSYTKDIRLSTHQVSNNINYLNNT